MNHIVVDFELNIHKINEDNRNAARLKFVNCISIFSRQRQAHNRLSNFQKSIIQNAKLTHFFLEKPNVLITKADKGNTSEAMDKNKYIEEIKTMLSDKITYKPLRNDPTNKTQKKVNNLIKL